MTDHDTVEGLRADYDRAPYESYSHPRSAPGRIAAIASIFGLDAPEVATARVLEIGCASAGNLIPYAAAYPLARTVGVDLSAVQIERGRRRVETLGLNNLELVCGDIAQVDLTAWGEFDFIICHGVYSWVPDEVQGVILAACSRLLAPDGVAYLSYNVYPGWKAKEIVRDAMLLSAPPGVAPEERVRLARDAVDFLQKVAPPDGVMSKALADYRALAAETGDYYLLHEELEAFNIPCYFRDLIDRARAHGLGYLADAQPEYMFAQNYGPAVANRLTGQYGHDQVQLEQHLDFVVGRSFRETLLVHAARTVDIRYRLDHSRFGRLHMSAWLPPATDGVTLDDTEQPYGDPSGSSLATRDPVVKAALSTLNDHFPWTLSHPELLEDSRRQLDEAGVTKPADLEARVDDLLEVLVVQGNARYRLEPIAPTSRRAGIALPEPIRLMAASTRDDTDALVFNGWHEMMPLGPLDRHLLPLLDGSRDRDALIEALMEVFRQNVIRIDDADGQLLDEVDVREVLAHEVDALPDRLAELRLLRVVVDS